MCKQHNSASRDLAYLSQQTADFLCDNCLANVSSCKVRRKTREFHHLHWKLGGKMWYGCTSRQRESFCLSCLHPPSHLLSFWFPPPSSLLPPALWKDLVIPLGSKCDISTHSCSLTLPFLSPSHAAWPLINGRLLWALPPTT